MIETLFNDITVDVAGAEFQRLLGYPPHHEPGERARELMAGAREWYGGHGRPWIYLREVGVELTGDTLRLDGIEFASAHLAAHLRKANAGRAILVAASAGRALEEHAAELWRAGKPDEYFFVEIFGSAVVEHLVAGTSGRICDLAARDGLAAIPHYSPGYSGWDVAEQPRLFELITRGATRPLPEPLEVLASGMLRPKKSLLGVFGLTARTAESLAAAQLVPCVNCSFAPCNYRRAPYRHATPTANGANQPPAPPRTTSPGYSVGSRALEKWSRERLQVRPAGNGALEARFRFDGTTCANLGRPLAFDYVVTLTPMNGETQIAAATCVPAPGDTGHRQTCAYLENAPALLRAIAEEAPATGQSLADALAAPWDTKSTGCLCDTASRAHKWRLALETIHFALTQRTDGAESPAAETRPSPAPALPQIVSP